MTAPQHYSAPLKKGSHATLLLGCAGAILIYVVLAAATLPVSPSIYPDEVMVTDYGRNVLEYPTKWSVVWSLSNDLPRVPTYWLGCVVQEWAYRISGPSFLGPRWSGIIGAIAAATFLLLWMRSAGVDMRVYLLGSAAFLYDPLLVAVARSGRPDTWVMALGLAACWLVRSGFNDSERRRLPKLVFAGLAAGLAPFFWPSAVFLLLLVAAELLRFPFVAAPGQIASWPRTLLSWASFVFGGLLAAAFGVGMVWHLWPIAWEQFVSLTNVVTTTGHMSDLLAFVTSFRVNPLLLPAAAAALVVLWRREKLVVLAVGATVFFMVQSLVYHFRAGFALPALYAAVILACGVLAVPDSRRSARRNAGLVVLLLLLLWNLAVSVGVRGVLAAQRAEANRPELLYEAAREYIGKGPHKVYDANMVFYYAGRSLGWKMYRPEVGHAYGLMEWNDERFAEFLRRVDIAIIPQPGQVWNVEKFSKDEANVLKTSGFELVASFSIGSDAEGSREWWDRVLLGGGPDYGSFDLYMRPGALDARSAVPR